MNKEPYFVAAAQEFEESVKEYLGKAKYNYILIEGDGKPQCWEDGVSPVIYGSFTDISIELESWEQQGYPIKNISIITEEEYIKTYLGEEVWNEYMGEEEFNVTIEIINTINTTIKAKDKASAVESAKTLFNGKEYKVFVNGELEYESN